MPTCPAPPCCPDGKGCLPNCVLRSVRGLPPALLARVIAESPVIAQALRSGVACRLGKQIAEQGSSDTVQRCPST